MNESVPTLTSDLIQRRNEEGDGAVMPLIRNGFLADNDVDLETMVRYYLVHPLLHFFNTVH